MSVFWSCLWFYKTLRYNFLFTPKPVTTGVHGDHLAMIYYLVVHITLCKYCLPKSDLIWLQIAFYMLVSLSVHCLNRTNHAYHISAISSQIQHQVVKPVFLLFHDVFMNLLHSSEWEISATAALTCHLLSSFVLLIMLLLSSDCVVNIWLLHKWCYYTTHAACSIAVLVIFDFPDIWEQVWKGCSAS